MQAVLPISFGSLVYSTQNAKPGTKKLFIYTKRVKYMGNVQGESYRASEYNTVSPNQIGFNYQSIKEVFLINGNDPNGADYR